MKVDRVGMEALLAAGPKVERLEGEGPAAIGKAQSVVDLRQGRE